MFTVANPCESETDITLFIEWWKVATDVNLVNLESRISELVHDIEKIDSAIAETRKDQQRMWNRSVRRELGRQQENLVKMRPQLAALQRAHPREQPRMILAVPGIHGFSISYLENVPVIEVRTVCLYGRDYRSLSSSWHRLGAFNIHASLAFKQQVTSFRWMNLSGNRPVASSTPVPAPQVDAGGSRGCMGDMAKKHILGGLNEGRIDAVLAAVLRYTEQPNHDTNAGNGMGRFPVVHDRDVPAFYKSTFR